MNHLKGISYMKKSLLALFTFFFTISIYATKTDPIPSGTAVASRVLPFTTSSSSGGAAVYTSFSQAIYTKTELGASEKEISGVEYFIHSTYSGSAITRKLQVWIKEVDNDSFEINESDACFYLIYDAKSSKYLPGTKVFDGNVEIPVSGSYTITFDESFSWSGNKNICVTVADLTCSNDSRNYNIRHSIVGTDKPRFTYRNTDSSYSSDWYWVYNNGLDFWGLKGVSLLKGMQWSTPTTVGGQTANCSYAPKAAFVYTTPIPVPTSPSASSITRHAATLGWTAASGADSYEVRYGTTSGSLGDATNVGNVTSYEISGLEESTTYYYQIRTKIGDAYSAWTTEASFTTLNHTHNAITFTKWTYSGTLPTSAGNYYLAHDVTLSTDWDPAGSINLCLNGKTVSMGANYGLIDDNITVAIYDEEGGGKITSSNSSQTLLASGSLTNLFIYAAIENTGSGRKVKAASGATASIDDPIDLSDADDNTSILAENEDLLVNISMTRSFTSAQYNTICLPFGLANAQLQYIFGEGYDLEELTGSSLDGDLLNLEFTSRTTLTAGKPYLLKPGNDVVDPSFSAVKIAATAPVDVETENVDFKGTFSPTELQGGNKNLLFLGAGNELFWPASTGNIKAFRAYFEVKGAAQKVAKRARIVQKENTTTGVDKVSAKFGESDKLLRNGQLLIIRDNKTYNVLGQPVQL